MIKEIIILGSFLFISGFFIKFKNATWLLAGYNEQRVADKEHLAKIVGGTYALLGALLLLSGLVGWKYSELLALVAVGVLLLQIVYVQMKLVK